MDLDGETNLKRRSSPKMTASCEVDEAVESKLQCVGPSGDLYSFDGALSLGNDKAAVSEQNLFLRSSRLRNTKWAVGMVVYTGQESKVMLNSRSGSNKQSSLETIVNKAILIIFLIQLVMAASPLSSLVSGHQTVAVRIAQLPWLQSKWCSHCVFNLLDLHHPSQLFDPGFADRDHGDR
eukprot:CAMPEP_0114396914 /NCGR_PEP_ID=MMETSP0102-20121206/13883_1 /TAXON_ID=38822 ORGANISM="Pteridomonas danica, Strain PT" /NCGR_SAMPLE_ID=MMETSP0102 /ASSEMBLY_ACC=CAM_ASM_000212 /LENGTH=178 /DNA_ID=CAMNT_0001557787 /DNA_START=153 /DNA_END=686 /DNA_ORIENTATION=+